MELILFMDRNHLPYLSHAVNYKFDKIRSEFHTDDNTVRSKLYPSEDLLDPHVYHDTTFNKYCKFYNEFLPKKLMLLTGEKI
ncbi:hypothetical protein K6025_03505 [Ehrlichia sp. JZT12]